MPEVAVPLSPSRYISIVHSRPYGYKFLPFIEASNDGIGAFPAGIEDDYLEYLLESNNRSIFDHNKRSDYRYFLQNPTATPTESTTYTAAERAGHKFRAIKDFVLQQDQLYRKGTDKLLTRYVVCLPDACKIIMGVHTQLHHAGIKRTHERIHENYYGITEQNVRWLLQKCNVCALFAANTALNIVTPILSKGCLGQVQIDLIDMRSKADGDWKWVLSVKDHFSHYAWLYALKDKTSAGVADRMDGWFGHNGFPRILQCDNGPEFRGDFTALCDRYNINVVNGRPYHPQTQGSVESFNKLFKRRLAAFQAQTGSKNWTSHLTEIALAINTTHTRAQDRDITPFQVWFGRKPRWQQEHAHHSSGGSSSTSTSDEENNGAQSNSNHSSTANTQTSHVSPTPSRTSTPAPTPAPTPSPTSTPSQSRAATPSSLDGNRDKDVDARMTEETESSLDALDMDYLDTASNAEAFATAANAQEKAKDALELTDLERRVYERNAERAFHLVQKAAREIVPLEPGAIATLKIPPKLRLETERARLPVRIVEVRMGRQYVLLTQYGKLTGTHAHGQLNPVTGAMADSLGVGIPAEPTSGEKSITLPKAVAAYNDRLSIGSAQKAGRKKAIAAKTAANNAAAAVEVRNSSPEYQIPRRKGAKPLVLPPLPFTTRARSTAVAAPARRTKKLAVRGRK